MRVLILVGSDLKRFKDTGGDDPLSPRLPLSYPFYGYLKDKKFNVEVLSINNVTWEGSDRKLLFKLIGYISLIFKSFYISSFDLIISSGFLGVLLSYILVFLGRNNKVCVVVYANRSPEPRTLLAKFKDSIFQFGLKLCGSVIYITKKQMEEAVSEIGLSAHSVYFMPIGVDTKFFTSLEEKNLIFVGEVVKKVVDKLYVVVSGDQLRNENLIVEIIKNSGLRLVRLTQSVRTEKFWRDIVKKECDKIDVFCKAHLSFQDVRFLYQHALCVLNLVDNSWQPAGWTVLTEAMACGIPAIMNKGLVTEELRLYNDSLPIIELSQKPSIFEIKDSIEKLKNNLQFAKDLGLEGRKFVETYLKIEEVSKEMIKILNSNKIY